MSRLKANLEILDKLNAYFTGHPDIRFHQGLWNLDIIKGTMDDYGDIVCEDRYNEDRYNEEPVDTLKRMGE